MNFGGLGGLGGRASSFPQRSGAPTSNIVEALPFERQEDWLSDWQRRYGELMSRANSGYWRDDPSLAPERSGAGDAEHPFRQNETSWRNPGSSSEWLGSAIGSSRPPEDYRWRSEWVDTSYTPDTSALDAERLKMERAYEARTRNQQAYDSMLNNGQIHGLIGPGYTNPNFGSVSGQEGAAQLPQIDGVNMDWASGVYNPQQASGMYGSTGRTYKQGWL